MSTKNRIKQRRNKRLAAQNAETPQESVTRNSGQPGKITPENVVRDELKLNPRSATKSVAGRQESLLKATDEDLVEVDNRLKEDNSPITQQGLVGQENVLLEQQQDIEQIGEPQEEIQRVETQQDLGFNPSAITETEQGFDTGNTRHDLLDSEQELSIKRDEIRAKLQDESFRRQELEKLGFTVSDDGITFDFRGDTISLSQRGVLLDDGTLRIQLPGRAGGSFIIDPSTGKILRADGHPAEAYLHLNGMEAAQGFIDRIRASDASYIKYLRDDLGLGRGTIAGEKEMFEKLTGFLNIQDGNYISPEDQEVLAAIEERNRQAQSAFDTEKERVFQNFESRQDVSGEGVIDQSQMAQQQAQQMFSSGLSSGAASLVGSSVPPGMEGVGAAFMNSIGTLNEARGMLASNASAAQGSSLAQFNDEQAFINQMQQRSDAMFSGMENMLRDSRDRKTSLLNDQEAHEKSKLKWEEGQRIREERRRRDKQLTQMVASAALTGAYGSSNANGAILEAERDFDRAIDETRDIFGIRRDELSIRFTEMHNAVLDRFEGSMMQLFESKISQQNDLDSRTLTSRASRRERERSIDDKYTRDLIDLKLKEAEEIRSLVTEIAEANAAEAKAKQDSIIATGDSISFVGDLTKEINGNKFIASARDVDTRFRSIKETMKMIEDAEARGDTAGKNFADQSLINLFNKITDPGSVVRESEFARSAAGLSWLGRISATVRKVEEGGVLEPTARRELAEAAKVLSEEYGKQLQRDLQPYIARVGMFNSQANVQTKVKLTDVLPSNLIPQVSPAVRDMWRGQMFGGSPSLGSSGEAPAFNPTGGPANGFRTDRHNNPTALQWTPRLEKWFNDRGFAVKKGDVWPNGKNFTLDMTDVNDPILATIAYIDAHSFFFDGSQRWSHTSMPKQSWDSLTVAQKTDVIEKMYRHEAGSGILFAKNMSEEVNFTPA